MGSLNARMPDELLDALNKAAQKADITKSAMARLILHWALTDPGDYGPPTLPNWRVEAWTALLRGVFGDERLVLTDDVKALLRQAVATLNEREKQVLRLRFGLGGPRYTLEEVGAIMGVTRERVRQIETLALARVRGWCRGRGIWELLRPQLEKEKT